MTIVLSIAQNDDALWTAGPEGLNSVSPISGELSPVLQPQQFLYVCEAIHDRILVGGAPYGVAFSLDAGENWKAGWMDRVEAPVVALAADPLVQQTGAILVGTEGGGILRSANRGEGFYTCNFGLQSYNILAIVWAEPAPKDAWPQWKMVFAGTDEGVYRSPNGGRGWKRCTGIEGACQTIVPAPDYHQSGMVLVGTEENGLWRSDNNGHDFEQVQGAPDQINALTSVPTGWLLSDESSLWHSADGLNWTQLPDSQPALVLKAIDDHVWAGGEDGVRLVNTIPQLA